MYSSCPERQAGEILRRGPGTTDTPPLNEAAETDQVRGLFEMPGELINGPDVVVFGVVGEPAQVEFIQEFLA